MPNRLPGFRRALALSVMVGVCLPGCTPRPLATSPIVARAHAVGSLRLTLGDPAQGARSTQWIPDATRARLTVTGPGMTEPLILTADLASQATASVNVSAIPAGPRRIVTIDRLDGSGASVPGGTLKTVVDIPENGGAVASIGRLTTPCGQVFERLLALDPAAESTADVAGVQALVERVVREAADYPELVDAGAIASDLKASGHVPAFDARYAQRAGSLDLTLQGVPGAAPADVWLDDPLSPKNERLLGGTHRLTSIVPGAWTLHVRSAMMGVEATQSVTIAAGSLATATVNLGAPADQVKAPMPQGIMAAASGVMHLANTDMLLAAGGVVRATDSVAYTGSLWSFDGTAWSQRAALPGPMAYGRGAVIGNSFYVVGAMGSTSAGPLIGSGVYRYDGTAWSTASALPVARGGSSVVNLNDQLYVIGGYCNAAWGPYVSYPQAQGQTSADFNATESYKFDPIGGAWTRSGDLPYGRGDMASAVVGGRIYVFGGFRFEDIGTIPEIPLSEVLSSSGDGAWRSEARMPTPRGGAAAVVANGKIFVIGGCTMGGLPVSSVEVFDPSTGQWSVRPPLRKARGYVSAGLVGGKIVVAGGGDGNSGGFEGIPQDTVESFVP